MAQYQAVLARCPLFEGIEAGEMKALLTCLAAARHRADKGEFLFLAGQPAGQIGIVLSGGVHIIKEDYWGDRFILAHIGEGGLFGEAFSFAGDGLLPVSAVAAEPTEVLQIDARRLSRSCGSACAFHARLIANMLGILAQKNVMLTKRMEHLTRRTTKEKLLSYLSACAVSAKSSQFDIPFSRQELADYLSVDRTALSSLLSKMQQEGLLTYKRNHFALPGDMPLA